MSGNDDDERQDKQSESIREGSQRSCRPIHFLSTVTREMMKKNQHRENHNTSRSIFSLIKSETERKVSFLQYAGQIKLH